MALSVVAIDCYFMSVCIHLRANLFDLIDIIGNLNKCKSSHKKIEIKIIECVKYHNEIINRITILAKISSPIVLAQFFISSLELCTLAFDMIMVRK